MNHALPGTEHHIELTETYAAHNYHPLRVVLSSGEGAWVTDVDGRRYLDCLAGYSALNFGHGHPRLVEVARQQIEYPDEDPAIRRYFEAELAKRGLTSAMPDDAYRDVHYQWKAVEL